jgi:hypothetical protein
MVHNVREHLGRSTKRFRATPHKLQATLQEILVLSLPVDPGGWWFELIATGRLMSACKHNAITRITATYL